MIIFCMQSCRALIWNHLLATSGVMEGRRATLLCEPKYQRAERRGVTRYRCPCGVCKGGGRPMNRATIQQRIESRGRDPTLTNTVLVRQPTMSKSFQSILVHNWMHGIWLHHQLCNLVRCSNVKINPSSLIHDIYKIYWLFDAAW